MYPIIPTRTVVEIKKTIKQEILTQKKDTRYFRTLPITKWSEGCNKSNRLSWYSISNIRDELHRNEIRFYRENYKKSENMWNGFSEYTGTFTNLNNMDKNDIEVSSGMLMATSLTVFSAYFLIQPKTVLYGQKKICWSP